MEALLWVTNLDGTLAEGQRVLERWGGGGGGRGGGQAEAVGKVRDGRWGKEEEGERGLCGGVEVRRKREIRGTVEVCVWGSGR